MELKWQKLILSAAHFLEHQDNDIGSLQQAFCFEIKQYEY